ncbi:flagellar hook-basal body protein [Nostoc sp. CHAB 5824]|nr:flagellar hook-basal body protein [Nostoc sp. CHAB 5824]
MERGLYAAATGMLAQQSLQDTIAQNIANAGSVGFKQDAQTFRAVQGMAINRLNNGSGKGPGVGDLGLGVKAQPAVINWEPGAMTQTGRPLDIALDKGLFLAVNTPRGERYTRAGDIQVNGNGALSTASGQPLVNAAGTVMQLPGRTGIAIDSTGNILADDPNNPATKEIVAKLKIVQVDTRILEKDGGSLFRATVPAGVTPARFPKVSVGTLEQSNMNPVEGMVRMIMVSRNFEMAHRAVTTQDELIKQAASEIGKV